MASIIEALAGQLLTGQMTGQLSQALGTDEKTARTAASAALPMILGALAKNAGKPDGAGALLGALDRDHDGQILDDLPAFFQKGDVADGEGILRHALGDHRAPIEEGISKAAGLDPRQMAKMMALLAPVVMGALGRARKERQLDTGGLSDLLRGEEKVMRQKAPEIGLMGSLLDKDGDGSIVDDVVGRIGKGLLGSLLRRN
ncbi:MAG: DUF937 domain-containing protein [Gemmatimonadota bacterium]